jgi:DNA-binding GntR family transcriptional regulator
MYVRIMGDVRRQIADGELRPRDKLPSLRELAEKYGCSVGTVRFAVRLLETEGVLEVWQGRGIFVAGGR